ncbi:MAG: VOC family protein [Nocardioides sp.]
MDPRIGFVTLAVDDLERALRFYRDGLGWSSDGIVGTEYHDDVTGADGTIAFVTTANDGLMIGLYGTDDLAKDAHVPPAAPTTGRHSIGVMVDSRDEVDALLARATAAGAESRAPAHLHPFGVYSGYFADPDGHLWEVAYDSGER